MDQGLVCSHCGMPFEFDNEMAAQVLDAIGEMQRHAGKATTHNLASELNLSLAQTRRYLTLLEGTGVIKRIGERGGWKQAA